ncbi:conjugal transfer protein precursor [Komagataeibacter europaeus LMG 18890]|nr:conjugal transfer protein precursor [Komagataeibacter europaeus LMG 18890]
MTRRAWFVATYFVVLAVGVSAAMHVAPRLLWNETASVPVGLYRLRAEGGLHVGDLTALRLPDRLALLLSQRGYLPFGALAQTRRGPTRTDRMPDKRQYHD